MIATILALGIAVVPMRGGDDLVPRQCWKIVEQAQVVGWPPNEIPKLVRIAWRESRCLANVKNETDPNGGSYGLMQINGFWCESSKYYPMGYLQNLNILRRCENLYEPYTNLRAALAIWEYSGWTAWGK